MSGLETSASTELWPSLPLEAWRDTYVTLHMWTQMVGKTRLALAPSQNHWWHVALYVTARGLTTGPMPYGRFTFQVDFDFLDHRLVVATSEGVRKEIALAPRSVADFYREYLATLASLGIQVHLWPMPCEVEGPVRFTEDRQHAAYDAPYANRFWRILAQVDQVLRAFRGRFLGKASPVHFFWGSFDLATTRFNGERAPERPELDRMMREAYSHKVISAGFWPGSMAVQETAFYAYAAPEPAGFSEASVQPSAAYYQREMKEFILPYDAVRGAPEPAAALRAFLESTYNAAADLAHWDRAKLERS
jgi:hypothetical protein